MEPIKENWDRLIQFASFVVAAIGAFVVFPPVHGVSSQTGYEMLAKVVAAAAAGLIAVPANVFRAKNHTTKWWISAILFAILFFVCVGSYLYHLSAWTCNYATGPVVVGSDSGLTQKGRDYFADDAGNVDTSSKPCEDVVRDLAGQPEHFWTKESINQRWILLVGNYVVCFAFFSWMVVCISQSIFCSSRSS